MLYHIYEMQHTMFAPARYMADFGHRLFKDPRSPMAYLPGAKEVAAACDVFEHLTRRYGKPKFGYEETIIDGQPVAITEEVVFDKPFCELKHFSRDTERQDPTLLVVAPMSGHYATLLRGTIEALMPDHDVYVTDWKDARDVPLYMGSFDLDDYIDYLIEFLEELGPNVHVMAVCQPSVPVMAAVSIMSAENNECVPASMTLMGGPVDTRESPTAVNELSKDRTMDWFEHHTIHRVPLPNLGFMRRVYPGFLQLSAFMNMNLEDHIEAHWKMFTHLVEGDGDGAEKTRDFYEEYLSVMDLPAEFYLQTIKTVFQDHLLPRRRMMSRGRHVNPSKINHTALLTIEGELDDISGIGQTKAAHRLCDNLPDNMKKHYEQKGAGHYGIFNGSKWRNMVRPIVKDFILEHHKG
ncbi:MAG: poly(3-hydroxybutyrate) depolymerase [Kordiimonas sp.]|nr:poly(3-hydroxybutyrate) depolymerase [Kordiimonas sp.]|tara:strand:- start:1410 stop:2633 length:1224 start_codon:yes stop_codon:yes gene_type:complete